MTLLKANNHSGLHNIYDATDIQLAILFNITNEIASDLMRVKSGAILIVLQHNIGQKGGIQLCH